MAKQKIILVSVLSLSFLIAASSALATLTFSSSTISSDGSLIYQGAGSVGNYIAANNGIIIKDAAGGELMRMFASDPDTVNYNSGNLYIGYQAGLTQPSNNVDAGYFNTGIGFQALKSTTLSSGNTAVGIQALFSTTTGHSNTGLGAFSLYTNTTGQTNAALGYYSLYYNTTGQADTAVGFAALYFNTTGQRNSAQGQYSLYYNTTGSNNSGLGYQAGTTVASAGANERSISDTDMVFFGRNAARNAVGSLTNGIAIGADATLTASNQAVIGNASVTDAYFGSVTGASTVHAADFQATAVHTAAPAGSDCDAAGETGKIYYDSTNDNLYICSGASGWRKFVSAAP